MTQEQSSLKSIFNQVLSTIFSEIVRTVIGMIVGALIILILQGTVLRNVTVSGMVLDCSGNGIKGIEILLGDIRRESDSGGLFAFEKVDPDPPRKSIIIRDNDKKVLDSDIGANIEIGKNSSVRIYVIGKCR